MNNENNFIVSSLKKYNILIWLSGLELIQLIFNFRDYYLRYGNGSITHTTSIIYDFFTFFLKHFSNAIASNYVAMVDLFELIINPIIIIIIFLLIHFLFTKKKLRIGLIVSFSILIILQILYFFILIKGGILANKQFHTLYYRYYSYQSWRIIFNYIPQFMLLLFYITNVILLFFKKMCTKKYIVYLMIGIIFFLSGIYSSIDNLSYTLETNKLLRIPNSPYTSIYQNYYYMYIIELMIVAAYSVFLLIFIKQSLKNNKS